MRALVILNTSFFKNTLFCQVTLGWIDKRCKQGKSLILTGDTDQLPPVADKPLYHAKPSNAIGEQGF